MSHLSDLELLELSESGKEHVASCPECSMRLRNLNEVQLAVFDLPEYSPLEETFNKVISDFISTRTNKNLVKWKRTSLALAASLLMTIGFIGVMLNSHKDATLDSLVLENQFLQTLISEHGLGFEYSSDETLDVLFYELRELDEKLQRAYIEDKGIEHKISLWSERKILMQRILIEERRVKRVGLSL